MTPFAVTPEPPYYAVIFTSQRTAVEGESYGNMAARMVELAGGMPGFLGIESSRDANGVGITVSYWSSEDAIATWKQHVEHGIAQNLGKRRWYEHYELRVAKVERAYSGPAGR